MPRLSNRKGFALPMAILVIAVLTVALAAGFAATGAEIGTNNAQRAQNRAYVIAQSGLEQFIVSRRLAGFCTQTNVGAPSNHCFLKPDTNQLVTNDSDYARVTIPGGYAEIVSYQVRPNLADSMPSMWFIKSRGVDTTFKLSGAGIGTAAERTVGVYAYWNTNTMQVLSAWTSLSGITKKGSAGIVDGNDQCGQKSAVAGVTTSQGDLQTSGAWSPTGSPPADTTKTLAQLESTMKIDWNGIINNNLIPADVVIPDQPWPSSAQWADSTFWPVIRIRNTGSAYSLPSAGRGLLIVEGDFTISGSNMWDGIILVGGALTSNGSNTTAGATVSGLNYLLPGAPQPAPGALQDNSLLNGTKQYLYNSCKVARASQGMATYIALPNTWMDNVASW